MQVKVVKMLVTVVVVFTFSWLPLYIVRLRLYYGPDIDPSGLEFSLLVQVSRPVLPEFVCTDYYLHLSSEYNKNTAKLAIKATMGSSSTNNNAQHEIVGSSNSSIPAWIE